MQLRNFLKQKQKNLENLQSEKNSRRSRWSAVFKQQLLLAAIPSKYKNTTWDQAKVGDKVFVEIESDRKSK